MMSIVRARRTIARASALIWLLLLSCSGSGDDSPGGQAGASASQGGSPAAQGGSLAQGGAGAPSGASGASTGGSKAEAGSPSSGGAPPNSAGSPSMIPSGGVSSMNGGTAGAPGAGGTAGTTGGSVNGTAGAPATAGTAGNASGGATASAGAGGSAPTAGAASMDATIVPDPSWACGMADGVPPPTRGKLVFKASLKLGEVHDVGVVQYGHRRVLDITGGTLTGEIQGTVLTGGLDLELELSNGSIELEQINIFRTSDNALIFMRTCGFAPAGDSVTRIVPDLEVANSSSLAWLNTGKFAGTRVVNEAAKTIELTVYDVSDVELSEPKIQIKDPAGAEQQPWECSKQTGSRGASVFTESVTLGGSLSVGQSKRGNRNIIPITGGMVSGRVTGRILPGGGDYQSSAGLDAKYTVETNDDEYIVIRNCGAFGALIPQFEARVDGPYAYLNTNKFLSSDPGSASGGVSITFYERQ